MRARRRARDKGSDDYRRCFDSLLLMPSSPRPSSLPDIKPILRNLKEVRDNKLSSFSLFLASVARVHWEGGGGKHTPGTGLSPYLGFAEGGKGEAYSTPTPIY